MLTRAQIQRMAQRNGIGMQVQERDYIQHLVLWLLYSRSQDRVFKGGRRCEWSTAAIVTQKT